METEAPSPLEQVRVPDKTWQGNRLSCNSRYVAVSQRPGKITRGSFTLRLNRMPRLVGDTKSYLCSNVVLSETV